MIFSAQEFDLNCVFVTRKSTSLTPAHENHSFENQLNLFLDLKQINAT